jgi:hypothetical protein
MSARRRRLTGAAAFALLALVAELTGRSLIVRLDRAFHVVPLAEPTTRYYPFLLAGVRAVAALLLAAVAWRLLRAHATAAAGERLLGAFGYRHRGVPQLRLKLDPRLWLTSFAATSLWYLVQNDAEPVTQGRWPLFAPWLHTYSLPVFAVLSVLLAIGWGAVRDWLAEVESYAAATFARVCRILRARNTPERRPRPADERAPRRLFGLVFESRPPPLSA